MALIYRAIFEVDDPDGGFDDRASGHAASWLRWKLSAESFDLPDEGELELDGGLELSVTRGADDLCRAFRIALYEGGRADGAEVKTTLTTLSSESGSWAWVDLERWTTDHTSRPWMPTAPGIVSSLLRNESARRGSSALSFGASLIEGDEGAAIARLVVDGRREIPLVVVSYNQREDDAIRLATERGRELAKRLAGVATVFVLARGAVSAFSREMLDLVGPDVDVHSGAVRFYLPGAGGVGDSPGRHRFVPYRTLQSRPSGLAATILAPPLVRRATEAPPPSLWRERAKALIERVADQSDAELLEMADTEITEQKVRILELEEMLAESLDSADDLLGANDGLARKVRYLRGELARLDSAAAHAEAPEETFEPVLCGEVAREARVRFDDVVIPDAVLEGADSLDAHGNISWALKAWLAFQAMQHYATAKRAGEFDGDLKSFCERSVSEVVISPQWVARKETKQTMSNDRFREFRVLPISTQVSADGRQLMEEHIKIQQGGTPSPRIHYFDDTRGSTGKIHVGWFGDHLDSRAKS